MRITVKYEKNIDKELKEKIVNFQEIIKSHQAF